MSYTRHPPLAGLPDVLLNAANDPCLGEATALVTTLFQPTAGALGEAPLGDTSVLCKAITPLKIAVYFHQRPYMLPIIGVSVVGALVGLGYILGSSRRCK